MTGDDEIARLEEACQSVWSEYERRMERMRLAVCTPDFPQDEIHRSAREVREALDLYLFLKRKQQKAAAVAVAADH